MSLLNAFPHTVRHERRTESRDSVGGIKRGSTTVSATVEAWVQNAGNSEVTEFQKRDQRISHRVTIKSDADIRVGDDLVVTSTGSFSGFRFKVKTTPVDRSAGLGKIWTVYCMEENNARPGDAEL